jgi:hypothetical protein
MTCESHQEICWTAQKYLDLWLRAYRMIVVATHHVLQHSRTIYYLILNK